MKHIRYKEYVITDINYLFSIPVNWELKKLKYVISESLKYGANEIAELEDRNLPRYIRITDINENGKLYEDTFKSIPAAIAKNYILQEGDILLARSGATVGKSFKYQKEWGIAAYAGYLIRARIKKSMNHNFVFYFLNSLAYWNWISSIVIQSTIQNVSAEKYANILIPMPSRYEQDEIVNYLDHILEKIDELIFQKEKLIELLEEKRIAIIRKAVTEGIKSNINLKSIHYENMYQIPENWYACKLMYLGKIITGGTPSRDKPEFWEDGTINWLNSGEINKRNIYFVDNKITIPGYDNSNANLIPARSVLIALNGQGKTKGMVATLEIESTCSQSLAAIVPGNKMHYKFLFYYLESNYKYIRGLVGEARDGLNLTHIKQLYAPVPPLEEQYDIISFLDNNCKRINELKSNIIKAVYKLREYKSTLITSVVTGQIDVRDFKNKK